VITNPFIDNSEVEYQRAISKKRLIKLYKNYFNIDINEILTSTDTIELYRCKKSGYKFFYPFNITGDSNFYEKLQEFDWYYMPWKWEHQVCKELIKEGDKILEVGCGKGDFIKNICRQYKNIQCTGLELNESSITSDEKYRIFNTSIEDYSFANKNQFDLVCSFQVLEHVPRVKSFLQAKIKCLKENGLLVISVPNNDSFIKLDKFNILNMPPHHMGLWTEESLKMIGMHFNLELVKVGYEPLQEYHFDYYIDLMVKNVLGKYASKLFLKGIQLFNLKRNIKKYIKNRVNKIRGQTVLIVFKKNAGSVNNFV
jgi:2-polyprenyl-3-methyl-5-hydroxy-6-metoxy-1,4-benzoquinol methylase